jgi:hypothetical protein
MSLVALKAMLGHGLRNREAAHNSEIHTKDINILCGQKVELLNVKLAVHIVTNGL